jgi:hypothetical protein
VRGEQGGEHREQGEKRRELGGSEMKTDAECNRCPRREVQCTCRPRSSAKRRVRYSVGRRARQSAAVSREDDREGSQRVIEPRRGGGDAGSVSRDGGRSAQRDPQPMC